MKDIQKSFSGIKALKNINFELRKGEVHALLGENGAGKSTLIKILSGIYQADGGSIEIDGKTISIHNPLDAIKQGIAVIHQELILADNMSIAENIFMGRERCNKFGFIDFKAAEREVQERLDLLGIDLKAATVISKLSTPQKQVVEIVKALTYHAKIVIMDEPTASLSNKEIEMLFSIIEQLKEQHISIIYISHRMEEIFHISDRVTVIRDGEYVDTLKTKDTDADELVRLMVGRQISDYYSHTKRKLDQVVLEAEGICTPDKLKDVTIKLHKGEILGLSGLVGAGRTELARAIFGIDRIESGVIKINGRPAAIQSPGDAIKNGIVLIPESRKEEGLILGNTVGFNITITVLEEFIKFIHVKQAREQEIIHTFFSKLSIKASSPRQAVGLLSGGNQQKAVVAKWLATRPDIIIMDEPTRGIDVGAKAEIYALMDELAKQGTSIIMISSELPEVLGMSDRIYVMNNGRIATCLDGAEATQENIMSYAAGVKND
ncbi:MAG: sugar ABC transporter ATP-binding protein [Clostridium sp.]|nr:sugar ABC transporter ATP-binding protein [Clostridium sp.]